MAKEKIGATEHTILEYGMVNILFQQTINIAGLEFDNLTAFGEVVIALGPPQHAEDTATRKIETCRGH